jgi:hypothetical protein
MKISRLTFPAVLIAVFAIVCSAQNPVAADKKSGEKPSAANISEPPAAPPFIRSTAAYAELLLVRSELASEIESLLIDRTESYPKIIEDRFHLGLIDIAIRRVAAVKAADTEKLTLALGKMLVRQAEIETELWRLKLTYADGHPEVKQTAKKLEIYEKAVNAILGS